MFPPKDAFKAMVGDAGSSGYFDIGTIRIQWGTGGSGTWTPTISFPKPFKDKNYALTVTICGGTGNTYYVQPVTKDLTNFSIAKRFQGGNATGENVDWIAIGLKP